LIGDILDLNSLSFHERGKYPLDGLTAIKEYNMVKIFDELYPNMVHNISSIDPIKDIAFCGG
jgi:hypothetical protein